MDRTVRRGKHMFGEKNMRGEYCLYGGYLDRPTPNTCQHEVGYCLGCQIFLDSFKKRFCDRCNEKGACGKEKTTIYSCQSMVSAGIWTLLHVRGV